MNRLAASFALSAALLNAAPGEPGTSVGRPSGLPVHWDAKPLGWVRVSQYTHVETRTRLTSSGYVLKIYVMDPARGLAFGIRHSSAYVIRPKHGPLFRRL